MRFNATVIWTLFIMLMQPQLNLAVEPPAAPAELPLSLPAPSATPEDPVLPPPQVGPSGGDSPLAAAANPQLTTRITLAQMGQTYGITLDGGNFQSGVSFTLPSDNVITHAQLQLKLLASRELKARNASLILTMNGQPLGNIALDNGNDGVNTFLLDIPAAMVVSNNNIGLKISDGEKLLCERNSGTKYQVKILSDSWLELEGQQLNLTPDLSHFPLPFFDKMQMSSANIAFVFPSRVTPDQVSAAALLASWFGIQADYRGVNVDVRFDNLPDKNGILFGEPGQQVGGITFPASNQPYLKLIDNPGNPVYKLLLIAGSNTTELRDTAWFLIHRPQPERRDLLNITPMNIPYSKPYDAPRWIPTTHPVLLSDLQNFGDSLVSRGIWHSPLNITFRAAPDLFLWDGDTIPMHINYRFPAEGEIDTGNSYLSVTLNHIFLRNLPINKPGIMESGLALLGINTRQESVDIPLPPYQIYGDNQLVFYFHIETKEDAPCNILLNNGIKSSINGDSWIDLSKARHFSLLPNLSYYIGAAFPFSRLADYAQTLLLLPAKPTETEISILMNLAARSGNATGTTLNHNRVIFGIDSTAAEALLRQNDILAVSSLQQATFYRTLLADSPFVNNEQNIGVRPQNSWQNARRWISGDWLSSGAAADRYLSSNDTWRGFISFQSPWNPKRVVVAAIGSSDEQLARLPTDLTVPEINASIRGDLVVITGNDTIYSTRVGPQFTSGEMPWYLLIVWYASQHATVLAILGVLFSSVFGLGLYTVLKRHAHRRLNPPQRGDKE